MIQAFPIRIKFRRHDGSIVEDAIRAFFNHEALLEPYARNTSTPAAVLTEHSWIPLSHIVEFIIDPDDQKRVDEAADNDDEPRSTSRIVEVDFDEAYSVAAGDEEVDSVYFDVAQDDAEQWFMSAVIDCETACFTDSLAIDDGPYATEDEALRAGLAVARQWMGDNDYSDFEIDDRLSYLTTPSK